MRPVISVSLAVLSLWGTATRGQVPDTGALLAVRGVSHEVLVRPEGPWRVHVVRIDLRRAAVEVRQVRAHDQLGTRERVSDMAARLTAAGDTVIAAVNADFFDLATGINENNQVIAGEWWRGVRVTDSPFDTYDNVHAQFGIDGRGRPAIDRWTFDGWVQARGLRLPLIGLNANPRGTYEGSALYTPRFGATTPRDTARATTELVLATARRQGDTTWYVAQERRRSSGGAIPHAGAVLAGYGARADALATVAEHDTLRVVLSATSTSGTTMAPTVLTGGWPRILRAGRSVADQAPGDEGTISRNAEARHPRTAIGMSRNGRTLLLVTVDGRSKESVGMTLVELAALMRELGAWDALNFDGGGSTTLVLGTRVMNTPSDPTGERAVGNAIVVVKRR